MKKLWKWLIPAVLILMGLGLRGSNATSFLGLISWCLAGLVSGYYLLDLLKLRRPRLAKLLWRVLTASVALGLVVVTATGIVIGSTLSGAPEADCEYIVVLGAKVNGTSPSRTLRERIDAAADYLKAHPEAVAVVSGGQGQDEGISEAMCMFNGLTDRGIAPERILLEDKATSTWENLNFSLALIEETSGSRPGRIGLVSSEFHLFRASLFARECGVEPLGIPGRTGDFVHFLNYFLREIAGVWHFLLLGEK